jgi:uncharacterized membrane protein
MYPLLSKMAEPASETASNGFTLAIVILIGMAIAVVYTFIAMVWGIQHPPRSRPQWVEYLTPALIVIGMGVSGYLTYIEITASTAVCGPLGDCNAVNTSSYARLFGVLPIGVMGLIGYIAILTAWLWGRFRSDKLASSMPLILFGLSLFGTLFSISLTYLEPFVIGAVCMWCLASAIIMTALLLLSINPALQGMDEVVDEISHSPQNTGSGSKTSKRRGDKRQKRK